MGGTIYHGDALEQLKRLKSESIDCVITSPPYFNLRDYRVKGQYGKESSPLRYMMNLLDVFDEVKRVLKKTGNCFIVLGDSYIDKDLQLIPSRFAFMMRNNGWILRDYIVWEKPNPLPSSADDRFTLNWEHVFHFVKSSKYFFETQYNVRPDGFFGSIMRSVWRIPVSGTKEKHFAVYPFKLIEPMIRAGCPSHICSSCGFMSKYIYVSSTINTRIGRNYGQSGGKTGSEDDPHRRTHQRDFSRYRQTPVKVKKLFPIGSAKYSNNDISRLYSGNEWVPNVKWLKACGADKNLEYKGIAQKDYESHKAQNASDVKRNILNSIKSRGEYEMTTCNCTDNQWNPGIVLDPFIGSGTTAMAAIKYGMNYIGIELSRESIDIAHKRIVDYDVEKRKKRLSLISKKRKPRIISSANGLMSLMKFGFKQPL